MCVKYVGVVTIKLEGGKMINFGYLLRKGSCGYYCLKHILKRVKCCEKRYLSLYKISEILKNNSYGCVSVRLNNVDDILFECLTLLKVNSISYHYVVLKRIKGKNIYYYDPLFLFVRKMKVNKFEKRWGKVCLFYTKV